jgi:dynein light chain Tctex-type 1
MLTQQLQNHILNSLISESRPDANTPPPWKFAINSTIIQHLQPAAGEGAVGRRGMHSATGAFWDQSKDGMWNYKYEGGEGKGMDVVISVVWIGL